MDEAGEKKAWSKNRKEKDRKREKLEKKRRKEIREKKKGEREKRKEEKKNIKRKKEEDAEEKKGSFSGGHDFWVMSKNWDMIYEWWFLVRYSGPHACEKEDSCIDARYIFPKHGRSI